MSVFKIDHYYNRGRKECKYAIVVESDLTSEELAKIVGAIQLMFEEVQDEHDCIDELHLLKLLESYYGVKNVKDQYRHVLVQTVLPDDRWQRIVRVPVKDGDRQFEIIQIDLYDAREFLCGKNYEKSFECLPSSDKFIADLIDLSDYYTSF